MAIAVLVALLLALAFGIYYLATGRGGRGDS